MNSPARDRRQAGGWCLGRPGLAVAALLLLGCGSAPPPAAQRAAPARPPAVTEAPRADAPLRIQAVAVREEAERVQLDLEMSGPLVWTSYRDADDNLVIELPNSLPHEDVADLNLRQGVIESAQMEVQDGGDRPLTRLVVKTWGEAEHSVAADGSHLLVDLMPLAQAEVAAIDTTNLDLTEPPAPEVEGLAPIDAGQLAEVVEFAPQEAAGTVDNPDVGPPPSGVSATQLQSVEVTVEDGEPVVWIVGDGEFFYSTFVLSSPDRFVVDLEGVVKTAAVSSLPGTGDPVDRVRVAQFKPQPDLVARVVVDLSRAALPLVERTGDGLKVRFAAAAAAVAEAVVEEVPVAAEMEPESEPEPQEVEAPTLVEEYQEVYEPAVEEPAAELEEVVEPAAEEPVYEEAPAAEAEVVWEEPEADPEPMVEEWAEEPAPEPVYEEPQPAYEPATVYEEPELAYQEPELAYQEPEPAYEPEPVYEEPAPAYEPEPQYEEPEPAAYEPPPVPIPPTPAPEVSLFETTEIDADGNTVDSDDPYDARDVSSDGPQWTGEPISMSLKDADIKDVLRSFAQLSDLNVVVQPGVAGTVTVELTDVPWDQALEQILKINSLDYQLEGNIMRVAPISQLRAEAEEQQRLARARALSIPLTTIIRRISYAPAADIARVLRTGGGASIMSQRGSVVVDGRTNTLIIKELPAVINTVIAVIENLDIPEPQVVIEARIIETTKRFTNSLGIDWGFSGVADAAHGNTTGLVFPNNATADGGVQLLTGARNGFLDIALGNVLNTFRLDATLQAAENEGLINILSAPKIATLNNERASIQSGLQIPIQTIANNTVSVQFINATLRLDVTPHVTAAGTVLMDIDIQKREPQLAFAVAGASNAPISTKDARTRVIVRDGGTTVIGGIYKVTSDQGEDRVPGLANVPILKHLFRNKRRNEENEELLIFITPRVVKL